MLFTSEQLERKWRPGLHPWQANKSLKLTTKQSLKIQRKRLNLVWPCLKVWFKFLTRSLSIKTNEKGFVYKCKLILRNLTCSLENQSWITFFYRMVSNTERVCHSIWRNVATRAKQMSSEILSVSEKTRRQFLQQKITYRDPSSVGSSLAKSSVFQAIFYCWRQSV